MPGSDPESGIVYTETTVHAAPPQFSGDAPYQLALVDLGRGGRITARILAQTSEERVRIGDGVNFVEDRDGVPYFRKNEANP